MSSANRRLHYGPFTYGDGCAVVMEYFLDDLLQEQVKQLRSEHAFLMDTYCCLEKHSQLTVQEGCTAEVLI